MNNYIKIVFILILIIIIIKFVYSKIFNVTLLNILVVLRGILAPNCNWYNISDLLLSDGTGINLYNTYKKLYDDFIPSYMFGTKIYIVTNIKYVKIILDNSPNVFNVGILKKKFFKSFMANNVGVSTGCPWKRRRLMNEKALDTNKLHIYSEQYTKVMYNYLEKWKQKNKITYNDFNKLGKKMVEKIVFNADYIPDDIFKIFSEANSLEVFYNPNFKINPKIYNNYLRILTYYINNPNENSLIKLCVTLGNSQKEILDQIPHFIFPIIGLFITTIPRLLILLSNHDNDFKTVIEEIYSINNNYSNLSEKIYRLKFLRKCILETLRLNNPVITTFRTLEKDYMFSNKYYFRKGTQFLILNNPILREKEFFKKPNQFIPSRWTPKMEQSYYAISFNQGPQICPGKELAIYIIQNFMYHFINIKQIGKTNNIISHKINTLNIPQVINPCNISFSFTN